MALRALTINPANRLSISLAARLTCLCPVNTRRDYATVEVSYCPSVGAVIELESFAAYLSTFSERAVSHEDVAAEILSDLQELTQADDLTVRTRWEAVEGVECVVVAHG